MVEGDIFSRILGTLILIAIIALPIYFIIRSRRSSWTGEIIDKESHVEEEDDSEDGTSRITVYNLKIKRDGNGAVKTHNVTAKQYEQFKVGDKVVKQPGKMSFTKA